MNPLSKHGVVFCCAIALSACQLTPPVQGIPAETSVSVPEPQECVCPEVEPPPPQIIKEPCPEPAPTAPAAPVTAAPAAKVGDKYVVGRIEYTDLVVDGASDITVRLKSRIDTGAGLTSMHAHDIVMFERDGKTWVRFALSEDASDAGTFFERPLDRYIEIKQLDGETEKRPVVSMALRVGAIEEYLEVNLTDRSNYIYPVLIGRNFLRDRAVVDVSRKFIAGDQLHLD